MKEVQFNTRIPEKMDRWINETVNQLRKNGAALGVDMTKKRFVISALENMSKDKDAQMRYFGRHLRQK